MKVYQFNISVCVLSCIDTVKTREQIESLKKRAEEDSSNSVVLQPRLNSSSKSTLYPIEIIEESEQKS